MTKPGTKPRGGTLQDHDDNCHTTFDGNDDYVEYDYMGLADFSQNPFHYEGFGHYEGSVLHGDYGQVHFMEMR